MTASSGGKAGRKLRAPAAPGRKPALSRNDVLDGAMAILDRGGHSALTVRSLAAKLGTSTKVLYTYFSNLADLEDEIAARLIAEVRPLAATRRQTPREQLVLLGLDLIRMHSQHPYMRMIAGPASTRVGGQLLQQSLAALIAAGLSNERAWLCLEILQSMAYNRGMEVHRLRSGGRHAREQFQALLAQSGRHSPIPVDSIDTKDFRPERLAAFHRGVLEPAIDLLLARSAA